MNQEIRVVAAIADNDKVVFYLEDGNTKTLKQTNPRLEAVLKVIVGPNSKGEVAIVNLETMAVYKEYEEKSKGFVKFFKAAKSAVAGIFGSETEAKSRTELLAAQPMVMPTVAPKPAVSFPNHAVKPTKTAVFDDTELVKAEPNPTNNLAKHQNALKPMEDDEIGANETIVGVFGNTAIPEMEKLKPYIDHALKNSSHQALENFFKRILPHIDKRGHSIQDLFRFMEKADMPIADDGTLIGYKLLKKTDEEGIFVDLHTKKVKQKVGSYVCVKEELVDRDRSNECSNGLHIARRGYIRGFGNSQDQLTLIKLAPEDVVTVPHGDASKVRAMGYHIVGLVSDNGHILARKNQPMTKDTETANFIANVIKGNHIGRIQEVRINAQYGGNVTYTDLTNNTSEVITDESLTAEAFDHNGVEAEKAAAKPINIKELNKQVNSEIEKAKTEAKPEPKKTTPAKTPASKSATPKSNKKPLTETVNNPPEAVELPAQRAARKKREARAAKKTQEQTKQETKAIPAKAVDKLVAKPVITPKVTPSKKSVVTKAKEAPKPSKVEPTKSIAVSPKTNINKARELYNAFIKDTNKGITQTNLDALIKFKRNAKISWEKLGFTEAEIKKITK